jgi:general secretion pathway protein A
MYLEHFGLKESPFSIAPDPRYLYMSEGHREALAHLLYGINNDAGFVLLTGEVGAGKTTICRRLLEKIPQDVEIAFILNPKLSAAELLAAVCDEFRISYPEGNPSVKVLTDRINEYLLGVHASGRRAVLILEEAQNLAPEVLEQLRLLTNLETSRRKLLQIILLGQPELVDMLDRPGLQQLAQRITARYHLGPLSRDEISSYVNHRLAVAGCRVQLFPPSLMPKLFRLSKGIPRLINVICDRALLGIFSQGKQVVDSRTLSVAAEEVFGKRLRILIPRSFRLVLAGLFLICCGVLISQGYQHIRSGADTEVQTGTASSGKRGYFNAQLRPLEFFLLLPIRSPSDDQSPANDPDSGRFLFEASWHRGGASTKGKTILPEEAVGKESARTTESEAAPDDHKESR